MSIKIDDVTMGVVSHRCIKCRQLHVSVTQRAMSAGVFDMPNRSKDRDQIKCGPLVLQVVGVWAEGC